MNDETDDLEQPEGDILTYTVSDEAPEAAAQTSRGRMRADFVAHADANEKESVH